jgi:glycosidase
MNLLAYTKNLIRLRKSHPSLIYGEIKTYFLDDEQGIWLAERIHAEDAVWVAVNVSGREQSVPLPHGSFMDLLSSEPITEECQLLPQSIRFLTSTARHAS